MRPIKICDLNIVIFVYIIMIAPNTSARKGGGEEGGGEGGVWKNLRVAGGE